MMLVMWLVSPVMLKAQDTTLTGILPVDSSSGKITYQQVIQVNDLNKDKLYVKAIAWINERFPNPSSVTTTRDPESGVIEGSYSIRLTDDYEGGKVPSKTIMYKFKLEFKEGRFRYTFTDFSLKTNSHFPLERWLDRNGPYYDLKNRAYLLQVRGHMDAMLKSLTDFMTKPEKPAEEEW